MIKTILIAITAVVVYSTTALSFSGSKIYILKFNPQITKSDVYNISKSTLSASLEYNFDPVLILAVMKTESHFDRYAHNSLDARGLMQIRVPVWFRTLKKNGLMSSWRDFYDPEKNTFSGVFILDLYRSECENDKNVIKCTLQRYNGDRTGSKYYMKVMKAVRQFHKVNKLELVFSSDINTLKKTGVVTGIRLEALNVLPQVEGISWPL